jgi:hypothetical protein
MDLGIGEIMMAIFGAANVGTFLWNTFEAITNFLGDEGSATMISLLGKGIGLGDYLLNHAVVDATGIVTGLSEKIPHGDEIVNFLQVLSQQMLNNGISWISNEGQQFAKKILNKIDDYSIYINTASASAYVIEKISEWKNKKNMNEERQKVNQDQVVKQLNINE